MPDWYGVSTPDAEERLLGVWEDAPIENLEWLGYVLDVARGQVLRYGRPLDEGAEPPVEFVVAQLQQAKNLWNAGTVDSSGDVGVEQFSYTPRPLDKTIRTIIRPPAGGPRVR